MNFNKPKLLVESTTARLRTALFHFKIAFNNFVIGCRIPQFLRSTKVVLIKFCALGIVKRLWTVISYTGIAIGGIILFALFMVGGMLQAALGMILLITETSLLPIYSLAWLITGKWVAYKLTEYLWEETWLFGILNNDII